MSVAKTNNAIFNFLRDAVAGVEVKKPGDTISVYPSFDQMDGPEPVDVPAVSWKRAGSVSENYFDSPQEITSIQYVVLFVVEHIDDLSTIEDAIYEASMSDPNIISIAGGLDEFRLESGLYERSVVLTLHEAG